MVMAGAWTDAEAEAGAEGADQILVQIVVWLGTDDVRRGQVLGFVFGVWASTSFSELVVAMRRELMMLISAWFVDFEVDLEEDGDDVKGLKGMFRCVLNIEKTPLCRLFCSGVLEFGVRARSGHAGEIVDSSKWNGDGAGVISST